MTALSPRSKYLTGALAVIAWFSVSLQCYLTLTSATCNGNTLLDGLVVYLGYFTILTNLLICLSLTFPLLAPVSSPGRYFARPEVSAGIATSILFVGLSYHFLLRNTWNPQGLNLIADRLLHYAMPALYLIHWWLVTPKASLRWAHPFYWGLYPAVYLVYALLRGRILGNYPYGFIDPLAIGYQRTMINSFGLLFVFFALGLLLVAFSRLQKRPVVYGV
jgi:hypothetical protein